MAQNRGNTGCACAAKRAEASDLVVYRAFRVWEIDAGERSGKTSRIDGKAHDIAGRRQHTARVEHEPRFKEKDRIENIRRAAEVAKLMNDAGLIVLACFISPYQRDRDSARAIISGEFIEVYVSTPIEVCEERDAKGLYAKARAGQIPNFTGISSPYEKPQNPEITIDTSKMSIEKAGEYVVERLRELQMI